MRRPGRQGPVLERFRPRMEQLFAHIDMLAERHGAIVVDLFSSRALADPRMWADDRLHLNSAGHERVAEAVWQALGFPPSPTGTRRSRRSYRRAGPHGAPRNVRFPRAAT
ncbi:hypothetical protein SRIMM317S_03203 [Streptomyces rimosus subsp. rimosus]